MPDPQHVAIVGLGPSAHAYIDTVEAHGGRHAFCDETWVINSYGDVLAHDRVFHMDDVRVTLDDPDPKIQAMIRWLRTHPGPVYTSRPHVEFPGMVAYPLEDVLNSVGAAYFNNSVAYAVAFALFLKVKKISLYGCDYAWVKDGHEGRGRACVEFWLGVAAASGVNVHVSKISTLMDANAPERKFYGYEATHLRVEQVEDRLKVTMTPRTAVKATLDLESR
ncbi:MAG: hypothetical protein Q8P46_15080 [Hyphomicrobiales bacterium]|nr:hypothetical protein [Hyphomicrobiales bacterium]